MVDTKKPKTKPHPKRVAGSRRTVKRTTKKTVSPARPAVKKKVATADSGSLPMVPNYQKPSRNRPPTVVIFGAGITGLTAAHELIERGFNVQVVERARSAEEEYGVEVGGIAANQQAVIKADLARLHPYLFPAEDNGYCRAVLAEEIEDQGTAEFLREVPAQPDDPNQREDREVRDRRQRFVDLALKVRATPLARSRHRLNLSETLQFRTRAGDRLGKVEEERTRLEAFLNSKADRNHAVAKEFCRFKDDRGISNDRKLDAMAMKMARGLINRTSRIADDLTMAEQFLGEDLRPQIAAELQNSELMEIFFRREVLVVEVRGHANPDLSNSDARWLGLARARFVRKLLASRLLDLLHQDEQFFRLQASLGKLMGVPAKAANAPAQAFRDGIARHLVAVSQATSVPIGRHRDDRRRSDRVDFMAVEVPLPGEHGYRYFPAYYRNLFDTMKRTPILDSNDDETAECTYDQLVTPPSVNMSLEKQKDPLPIARQQFRSMEDLRKAASALLDGVGLESRDLHVFMLRVFTFMTACKDRRRSWEDRSWMEFLRGRTALSDAFTKLHQDTALALLSMDADEADAYSYALNAVQLLLDYRGNGGGVDMTLNGPTSETWLRPWKRYLVRQGVEFFQGEILDLIRHPVTGEVVPRAVWHNDPPRIKDRDGSDALRAKRILEELEEKESLPGPMPERHEARYAGYNGASDDAGYDAVDFYVLALPFEQAGRIARAFDALHPKVLEGDWARLVAFDQHCIPRDEDGHDLVQCVPDDRVEGTKRSSTGKPNHPNYPLRDLSGIQFFFPNNVQVGRGHVIHGDSEWGLTSIAQATHWRARLSRREGYLGQLSVDIGNFYREHAVDFSLAPDDYLGDRNAEYKKDLQVPKTAWRCPSWEIPLRVWDQIISSGDRAVDPPTYYHMDDGIVLHQVREGEGNFYPAENRTPFLINLPGQWRHRPGVGSDLGIDARDSDEARCDVGYQISNDRWVLAGTYMATHTRLMTMEACNESARHAVNAILDAIRKDVGGEKYNSYGKQLGQRCEIFDPYEHEVDDLGPFKELDEALYREGLPHFIEILGIDRLVESMPRGKGSEVFQLGKLFDVARTVQRSGRTIPGIPAMPEDYIRERIHSGLDALADLPGLDNVIRKIKEWIG